MVKPGAHVVAGSNQRCHHLHNLEGKTTEAPVSIRGYAGMDGAAACCLLPAAWCLPSAVCHPSSEASLRRNQCGCSPPLSWASWASPEFHPMSPCAVGVDGSPRRGPTAGPTARRREVGRRLAWGGRAQGRGTFTPGGAWTDRVSDVRVWRMGGGLDRCRMQSLCLVDACAPEHVANFLGQTTAEETILSSWTARSAPRRRLTDQ